MSRQDIEKRLGFAAQGVKETTRTSAKAKFDREVGRKGNKSAMITKNGPDADASWLAYVVQHHGEGQGESVLGTMRSYSTEARAKAAALRGLETSGLRGGFARPGVKATFAEFNVGDKVVYVPDSSHIDAYGRIIKIENGIAIIASAEGNVKAKLSDLELVKKGSVEDLRRLGMKGFARPGVKAEFYASPEHLPMILAKTRKMHEESKKAAEKYLQSGSVGNQGGAAGLANSMVNSLERDLKNDLYRLTQSRNPVHKKAAKEAYAEIKAMADWWYMQYKKWTASRPGVKAKMAAEIASDPRDKDFEKLKTLKGVVHQGKGFYIIPNKLMTPERRTKVKRSTQRYELSNMGDLVGWGTNHPNVNDYRLKDWAEAFA